MEYDILSIREMRSVYISQVTGDTISVSTIAESNGCNAVIISNKWDYIKVDIKDLPMLVELLTSAIKDFPCRAGMLNVV